MPADRVLLLGVGNALLSDEGFGAAALAYLEANYIWPENVRMLDGGTGGMLLMADLMDCDVAVILDTVLGGGRPGTFYFLDDADLAGALSARQSMHQTSLADVLISCDLAGARPRTFVFGFEPFDIVTVSPVITPAAQRLLPDFCARVVARLQKLAIFPRS